jgi:hypothetical protein
MGMNNDVFHIKAEKGLTEGICLLGHTFCKLSDPDQNTMWQTNPGA